MTWSSPIFLAVSASFFFSCALVLVRTNLHRASPAQGALMVAGTSAVVFALAALFRGMPGPVPWAALPWFALAGVVGPAGGKIFNFTAVRYMGAARSSPLMTLTSLFGVGLAVLFLGERPTPGVWFGVILLTLGGLSLGWERAGSGGKLWHFLFPLAAVFLNGTTSVFRKVGFAHTDDVLLSALIGTGAAFGALVLFDSLQRRRGGLPLGREVLLPLLLAGLFTTLAQYLYNWALSAGEVSIVQPLGRTGPLFTLVISRLFLQRLEQVNAKVAAGASLMVAGAMLVAMARD